MDKVKEQMDEAYKYFKQLTQKPNQDECSLYTELLCKKLRGMQEKTREVAMLEIDKIIFNLKQWETQCSSSHSQTQITTSGPYQSQHSHQQQPFNHSTTYNAYSPFGFPQMNYHTQQFSPFNPSPSQPSLVFHPPTSQPPSAQFHPSPSSQPSPNFHHSPSPQLSPFNPSPCSQPSPTFRSSPSP